MTDALLRSSYTARTSSFVPFTYGVLIGSDLLLTGEADGMASDFTESTGVGYVSVKDTGTPANNLSNVIGDLFWTQSGTSPKLVRNSTGTLQWSPHNYNVRSEQFDHVSWGKAGLTASADATTAPDGSSTADQLIEDTSTGTHRTGNVSTTASGGQIWTNRIRVKPAGRTKIVLTMTDNVTGSANILFTLSGSGSQTAGPLTAGTWANVSGTITDIGSGWYDCTVTGTNVDGTSVQGGIYLHDGSSESYTGDGASGVYAWGGQLNRGPIPTAYLETPLSAAVIGLAIDYDGTNYGLLTEPAATNLLTYSQAFDNAAWNEQNIGAVSAGSITAPDSTATAETFTASAGSGKPLIYQGTITISANANYNHSFYVKKNTHRYPYILSSGAGASWFAAVFDLDGGGSSATETAVGVSGGAIVSTSQTAIGNGWYRITVTASLSIVDTSAYIIIGFAGASTGNSFDATNGQITWTPAGTESFYVWGAQMELGTVATSPIPTFAATVTRASDDISKALTAIPFSTTLGAVYTDFVRSDVSNSGLEWLLWKDSNERMFGYSSSATKYFIIVAGGAAQTGPITTGGITANVRMQASAAWKVNDCAMSADGGAAVTDTSVTLPTGLTTFYLGNNTDGVTPSQQLNGHIYRIIYVPRRVIDADLPTWRYNY